ncbi:hypothetical protein [Kibdelosporangium philippinense]
MAWVPGWSALADPLDTHGLRCTGQTGGRSTKEALGADAPAVWRR